MVLFRWMLAALLLAAALPLSAQEAGKADTTAADTTAKTDKADKKKKKNKGKDFSEVVEDMEVISGLFTFYRNVDEEKVYMEIKPEQLGKLHMVNITREAGDGSLFDGGAMLESFPFFFHRQGKQIQWMEKNMLIRADSDAAIARAVERDIPNSIRGSSKILSEPHPERGSLLIDASDLFITDVGGVGTTTGRMKMAYSMDKGNSWFSEIKSFEGNSEIEVTLHFTSGKSQRLYTLADSRSMIHRYHYSIAAIPVSGYTPRLADDRVGHFTTYYQDYSSLLPNDPYTRYVERWHLEKSEPAFDVSPPRKPIVFWLENTIPVEYRDAVREGVLMWNPAFERIGFKDAIVVKQMPDDAEWDPADSRYNTIRWIVQPGGGYAVGPSHANPETGELFDADIRISGDFVRYYNSELEEFITPNAWQTMTLDDLLPGMGWPDSVDMRDLGMICRYGAGLQHQMAFGWSLVQAGLLGSGDLDREQFIHDGLKSLVAHEVGHTLGLRHNFKSSSIHSIAELDDPDFARRNGLAGSVMDYTAINVGAKGGQQGSFFQTTLGPYDYWAIEYAYTPYDGKGADSEAAMLEKIAEKGATDPNLVYATDEDAFGLSPRSIDPRTNLWDLGSDPLAHFSRRLDLTAALWKEMLDDFDREGLRYARLREIFGQGIGEYGLAGITVSKLIGGIHHRRDHIGDPKDRPPFEMVSADRQRAALAFLNQRFFSPGSFRFSPALLNRLAPERQWDFQGTPFQYSRLDYPIHGIVQVLQSQVMFRLFNPLVLARIQDNEIRFPEGEDPFTMVELFEGLRESVWQELGDGSEVNSFRRELQRIHLYTLENLVLRNINFYPHDAVMLARADLRTLRERIRSRLDAVVQDTYTRLHLEESLDRITAMLEARKERP